MTATDAQLLADFATRRDEAAFRELTRRHLGLVFHTALRCTGNRALSEEIAQNVLCAVAAKAASLARHPERFAAWLHRAAVFESSKAMRKEASHQRRSRLQHPDAVIPTVEEDDGRWQAALPLLDTALDSLPESDRRVVVLHFFERQPFAQIGALLEKTPAAVQKQSVRALEKLARILKGKGVAIPVGLLATGIAIESAKAAPIAVVSKSLSAALASANMASPAASPLKLVAGSPYKVAFTCMLLAVAFPAGWQRLKIVNAEKELSLRRSTAGNSAPALISSASGSTSSLVSRSLELSELVMEAKRSQNSEALKLALRRKLETARPEELGSLLSALRVEDLQEADRFVLGGLLAEALARKDLNLAMEKIGEGWIRPGGSPYGEWVTALFYEFAQSDPKGAVEWIIRIQQKAPYSDELERLAMEAGRGSSASGSSPFGDGSLVPLQAYLLSSLVSAGKDEASKFLRRYPEHTLQGALIAKALSPGAVTNEAQAGAWFSLIRDFGEGNRKMLLGKLGQSALAEASADIRLESATPLIQAAGATPEERHQLAVAIVKSFLLRKGTPVLSNRDEEVRRWLAPNFDAAEIEEIAVPVRAEIDRNWEYGADSVFQQLDRIHDAGRRESTLLTLFQNQVFKGEQLKKALRLAGEVSDETAREHIIQLITENSKQ